MIFRAVFWVGLVSLLTPHEPDLGLGRPGAGIELPAIGKAWTVTGLSRPGSACVGQEACAGGPLLSIDGVRLEQMRADIAASIKARAQSRS